MAVAEDQDGERAAGRVPLLDLEHEERLVEALANLQKIETAGFHRMLEVSKWVNIGCGPRAVSKRGCAVGSGMPFMHVLVLERDPERRDALLRALRAEGHHAVAAPDAAAAAGARGAFFLPVRLPHEVAPLFRAWLDQHHPDRAAKVMATIRAMRGGKDNDPNFFTRMRGQGVWGELLSARFAKTCARVQRRSPASPAARLR